MPRNFTNRGINDVKLNMGKAWSDATGLFGANRDTIFAVAGLFFFLPYLALAIFAPEAVNPTPVDAPPGTDPDVVMQAAMDAFTQQYADNWPYFLIVTIVQFIGTLSLLALLTDRGRPTVGEALQQGVRSVLPYIAAQLLIVLAIALIIAVPVGILSAISPPVAGLVGFLMVIVAIYIFVKFALVSPVIAIEGELNPIKAMRRSWGLTKGNSLRLFGFMALLVIAIGVVSLLVTLVLGTVFAAFNASIAAIGNGVVSAIINAVIAVLFLCVLAAVHRQLAGPSNEATAETFE